MAVSFGTGNRYKPLTDNEIRLLHLEGVCLVDLPGNTQDFAIKCHLETVSLSSEDDEQSRNKPHKYTALSYCWGSTSSSFRRRVLCDGVVLRVTINLFDALYQLSLEKSPEKRLLWVDAICINQNDVAEKSLHVRRMSEVFSQASMVLIWLGTGADSAGSDLSNWWGRVSDKTLHGDERRPVLDACKAAKQFFEGNAWFKRVWTFQEIVLAKNPYVQCGRFCISWDDACRFCDIPELTNNINKIRETKGHRSLATLVSATTERRSTVDFDRVYSLLGIYQGNGEITVNYACLVTDIFAEAAHVMVRETGYLFFVSVLLKELPLISKLSLAPAGQMEGRSVPGAFPASKLVHPFRASATIPSKMGKSWVGQKGSEVLPGVCFKVHGMFKGRRPGLLDFRGLHAAWRLNCEPNFHTRSQNFPTMLVDGAILGEYVVPDGSRNVWPIDTDADFGTFRPIECRYVSQLHVRDLMSYGASSSSSTVFNLTTLDDMEIDALEEEFYDDDDDDDGFGGGKAYSLVSAETMRLEKHHYHAAELPRDTGLIFTASDVFNYVANRHDAAICPCQAKGFTDNSSSTNKNFSRPPPNPEAYIAPLTDEQRQSPEAVREDKRQRDELLDWRRRHFRRYWLVVLFGSTTPVILESQWYVHSNKAVFAIAAALDRGHRWSVLLRELAAGKLKESVRSGKRKRRRGSGEGGGGEARETVDEEEGDDDDDDGALRGLAEMSWVPARFELM